MQNGCDIIEFGRAVDEPNTIVLNFLKPVKVFWGARKKSIETVKHRWYERASKTFCDFFKEVVSDCADSAKLKRKFDRRLKYVVERVVNSDT